MNTTTALRHAFEPSEAVTASEPVGVHLAVGPNLADVSDEEVLENTLRLVGRSNQIFATLLVHLGEVETRGLYRLRACSSLYTYCIYELRFSEDAAFRRVSAARLVKRFPALLGAVERGELHLTGLLMLGPCLTPENHVEVLALAKHRTKKEIAKLVRVLDPLPDVPARIAPLGPALARVTPTEPSWERLAHSLNPVRALNPGDRPADWIRETLDEALARDVAESDAPANDTRRPAPARVVPTPAAEVYLADSTGVDSTGADSTVRGATERASNPLTGPQRYHVQFTASDEYVDLVERAKVLLSHAVPNAGLAELHLRAMRALVAALEKRKYAAGAREAPRERVTTARPDEPPARPPGAPSEPAPPGAPSNPSNPSPRQRGRAVPVAVRRAVWSRDEGRCSYVDGTTGQRCRETHRLELHHETAYAHGGSHIASNLTLRCRAHNALAAEADFGREFCVRRRDGSRHEARVRQRDDYGSG